MSRRENRLSNRLSVGSDSSQYHHALEDQTAANEDLKNELTHVMADMGSLRGRLQGDFRSNYAVSDLESYLDAMQLHATNLGYRLEADRLETPAIPRKSTDRGVGPHHPSSGPNSSMGDEPDSAIDINDGPPSPYQPSPQEVHMQFAVREKPQPQSQSQSQPQPQPTQDDNDTSLPVPPITNSLPIVEIEEFLDELHDSRAPSTRAPTPPPKARGRCNSVMSPPFDINATLSPFPAGTLPGIARPPSTRSISEYSAMLHDSEGNTVVPRRVSSLQSLQGSDGDARSTLGSLKGIRPPFSVSESSSYGGGGYGAFDNHQAVITTTIVGGSAARDDVEGSTAPTSQGRDSRLGRSSSRLLGRKNSFTVPGRSTRPESAQGGEYNPNNKNTTGTTRGEKLLHALAGPGAALAIPAARTQTGSSSITTGLRAQASLGGIHNRHGSVDTTNSFSTQSTGGRGGGGAAAAAAAPRPSLGAASTTTAAASIRSSSSRVSSVLRRINLWRPSSKIEEQRTPLDEKETETEPDDIFGVSLKKSMQMASASVRTHHDGSKHSSRREFPRCVLMCVSFIKDNRGMHAPHIFGGDSFALGGYGASRSSSGQHMVRVAALKEKFSTAPHYGEGTIDWRAHDVYDAAELLVLFLQQLPKPLISETVAKRWIVMSKQATLPGSMGLRLDSCIDFWDEALLGVRGAARSLFKLLLNLWGDIADAAELNDMTAERLAARLLNPLMHLPAGKYTTDFMLGLAFLIRKRSEYAVMLREGRQSHAAF